MMNKRKHGGAPATRAVRSACASGALFMSGAVAAFPVEVGNPDIEVRWDNTVRYNLGVRAKDCDVNICGNDAGAGDVTAYQSDRKFGKAGNVVTNRIDLLSEFDLIYKKRSGFRASAAAWYDAAYKNKLAGDVALDASGAGQGAGPSGGPYADYTKRYAIGPSGEFLDAFVFAGFDLGSVPVNLKLGQHNIYWGESLFSFVGGVAYNQGPVDIRKAIANVGVEAKEVFKPLKQVSLSAQLTPDLTLMGQYLFDWKPSPVPDGGTYFGAADGLSIAGIGTIFGAPTRVSARPDSKRGDWGLAAKWRPDWLDGSLGLYYREFTNKFPQLTLTDVAIIPGVGPVPTGFGLNYASTQREKLIGLSLAKQVAGVSIGADITYRPDAVLQATPFQTFVPAGTPPNAWAPTGNIWSGVINAIAYIGKTPVFDSAALTMELNVATLSKVTANAANYNGNSARCTSGTVARTDVACQTKTAIGAAVQFEPKWFQVWSGVDVTAPMFVGVGLKGNSPILFGDNKGQGSWSVGLAADIDAKYSVALKYNGFLARHSNDAAGAFSNSNASLGKYWDRDWVSLTFKTSF